MTYSRADYWPLNTALYVTDFHGNDERFAYYFLRHFDFRSYNSGSAQPSLNRNFIHPVPITIPSVRDQRVIAQTLGALDDKIELNRRMSETLEAMARALFQSWFVDFDPVRAKAEGRDTGLPKEIAELFPDSFEESELGEIPRGWGVGTFNDVVDMLREQVNPQAFPTTPFQHYSLPAHDDGKVPAVELGADIKSNKFVVTQDVVLMSKLNPTIERVWLVDLEGTERAIASTEFLVLRPRAPYGVAYTYCLARDASFRRQVQELVTGTSNSHQRAQAGLVLGLRQILPSQAAVLAFESMTAPLLERVKRLRRESRTVTALRDTLMPPLISGQLRTADQQLLTGGARHGAN